MKILFVTPQFPAPPTKGTTLRNYHLIRGAARHHMVGLVSILAPGETAAVDRLPFPNIPVWTAPAPVRLASERLMDLARSSTPDLALRLRTDRAAAGFLEAIAQFEPDLIQFEAVEAAGAIARASSAIRALRRPLATVYDAHNAEFALQRSAFLTDLRIPARVPQAVYSFIQWKRLVRYEARLARSAARTIAVSPADARLLEGLGVAEPAVVPNGVDTSYYRPNGPRTLQSAAMSGHPCLIFVGTLDFRPNVDALSWFVHDVLPLVRADCPAAHLLVVGRNPGRAVRALASAAVSVIGEVEDERPWLARADCYVVPLRMGGGMRFKVVQAMASGIPIVSTRFGADGVAVEHGRELLLADHPAEFARAIAETVQRPEATAARVDRARRLAVERYDWQAIFPALDAVYAAIEPALADA